MKIDDASWHYGGKGFPEELPPEAGATHIGMFFAWAVLNGLVSDELKEDLGEELESLHSEATTPGQFVWRFLDGKLSERDLSADGRRFAESYYSSEGGYLSTYQRICQAGRPSEYCMADSWDTYRIIAPLIDSRYRAWLNGPPQIIPNNGQ
jgi:hypothetical protein